MMGERIFQEEDVPWFIANKRSMNLYEPRLGKTVVTCRVLAADPDTKRVLIVSPKNALYVWRDHIIHWFEKLAPEKTIDVRIVYRKGSNAAAHRKVMWSRESNADIVFWIVTYGTLDQDIRYLKLPTTKAAFDTVVGDEVHKRLRNRKNKAVQHFKWLTRPAVCTRFHALSGTMASKGGPADFWALLNMIDPQKFSSYWEFANTFVEYIDNGFGREAIGPKNLAQFWALMDRYSRRRFRADCAPYMPKVQRELLRIPPTVEQTKLWANLKTDNFAWVGDELVVMSTSMEAVLRRRQLLTCPKLLNDALGYGAALEDITERLLDPEMSPEPEDQHVVIFSAFRQALPHFETYLRQHGFLNVWQLYGGMDPQEQADRIAAFRQTKGIILCSIAYAEAFSLVPASQCFFIGYDWDPNANKQAEDRLVPQTGHAPINSYYYSYIGMDEDIADAVHNRNKLITLTLGNTKNVRL